VLSLREYVEGEGPPPDDLVEGRLVERFGWTFDELDGQDEGRVLRTVSVLNLADGYMRVMRAIEKHRPLSAPPGDWEMYKQIRNAE